MTDQPTTPAPAPPRRSATPLLLVAVGIFYLGSGVYTSDTTQLFWGLLIIGGAALLHFVRKKDWKAHWEEQARYREALDERRKREKEQGGDDGGA